eukprot:CAMPEP_0171930772 /NCGR_PEP_ID=MMETSP0993-20121228/28915_1 /TAXON_ID=483369 /ORGANISM="non described non described, Strain CCMP2098" /LENGTH=493 /DNA_ID=CAMNT_0012570681 /DNA_START=1 /DNA_END=1479 /DNA_ORIENTATION=+
MLLSIFAVGSLLKVLLAPSYHSTDYEVHRNWLAVTSELRPSLWYYDVTSPWTLDYPPLFAWFERSMVPFSRLADPLMLTLSSTDYMTNSSFAFMRSSVGFTDCMLFAGTLLALSSSGCDNNKKYSAAALVFLNAGLFMVDHMHFQFNGFLFGVLLLSIGSIRRASTSALHESMWGFIGGALFAALLVLKHLFLPLAPVFFVHLLLGFCWRKHGFSISTLVSLGAIVVVVMIAPFVPLILDHYDASPHGVSLVSAAREQLQQIGTRLFPFVAGAEGSPECNDHDRDTMVNACHERGLVHAYWAANIWALYLFTDRVLAFSAKRFPPLGSLLMRRAAAFLPAGEHHASPSSGLVGSIATAVLPNVSPSVSAIITLAAIVPALVATAAGARAIRRRRSDTPEEESSAGRSNMMFDRSLVHASLSAFMFGWHVHEKAILMSLVPLSFVAVSGEHPEDAFLFLRLSGVGLFALFPLFTRPRETPTKALLYLCYMRLAW